MSESHINVVLVGNFSCRPVLEPLSLSVIYEVFHCCERERVHIRPPAKIDHFLGGLFQTRSDGRWPHWAVRGSALILADLDDTISDTCSSSKIMKIIIIRFYFCLIKW